MATLGGYTRPWSCCAKVPAVTPGLYYKLGKYCCTIMIQAVRHIMSTILPSLFHQHLLWWEYNLILHPRFTRITPPATATLNHIVLSNPLRPQCRRGILCPHQRTRPRAERNTSSSSTRPVDWSSAFPNYVPSRRKHHIRHIPPSIPRSGVPLAERNTD